MQTTSSTWRRTGLARARQARGLSLEQLAQRAGISVTTIFRIEHRRGQPNAATVLVRAAAHDRVWTFLGFPTYRRGRIRGRRHRHDGAPANSFLLVCAAELIVGWMLWRRHAGILFSLGLLPCEFAFWIGFALPFGPVVSVARSVLVAMAWSSSRGALSDVS